MSKPAKRTNRRTACCDPAYGRRLTTLRWKLRLTEAEAAEAIGVRLDTYRRYEATGRYPRGRQFDGVLCYARDNSVYLDWLFAGKGPMFLPQ